MGLISANHLKYLTVLLKSFLTLGHDVHGCSKQRVFLNEGSEVVAKERWLWLHWSHSYPFIQLRKTLMWNYIYAMVVAKSAIYFHAFEVAKACCILPQWCKICCPSWPSPLSKNQQAPVCSTATPTEPYITSLVSSNLSHHIRDRRHLILRIKLVAVHVAFFSCIDRSSTAFPDFARQTDKSAEQPTKSFSCLMSRFTWFRPGVGSCFTVYL